jgi:MOSC domain-containing protein YiiM
MGDATSGTPGTGGQEPGAWSLARCAEVVLGWEAGTVPIFAGDNPLARLGEWLAGRNLGLVRARHPERFAWPGGWIALLPAIGPAGFRAVVMFGVPSGLLHDPLGQGAAADGAIADALVVAPLDPRLPYGESAYGGVSRAQGAVEAVLVAPAAGAPCVPVGRVRATPGRGLTGDRYADGTGTFSAAGRTGQDLTLIEAEALELLAVEHGVHLSGEEARRNVVTRGIDLNGLVGRRFAVGAAVCVGVRLCEPCAHLQRLTRDGVLRGLVHRGGIRADVVEGGDLAPGDTVHALPDS